MAAGPASDPAALERALALAYRHLGRRDRTVTEVRDHLTAKGIEEQVVAAAVAELSDQGYLDDARFAQRFAEDRRTLDGWGRERIGARLAELGVAGDEIDTALGRHGVEEEREAAAALLRRRMAPPATERERERALGLLVRRGYELDVAYDAVRAFARSAG